MKLKIGQEITIQEDFEIETPLSHKKIKVQIGDKGFIDSNGLIHYTTGKARGKIQKIDGIEVDGYDYENIANLIFKKLNSTFDIKDIVEDYDISTKDFTGEIEDILSDIF